MTAPANEKIAALAAHVEARLSDRVLRVHSLPDELCYEVQPAHIKQVCLTLRDDPALRFEVLVDLAGVDYLEYASSEWKTLSATHSGFSRGVNRGGPRLPHDGARFAVAYNLLSVSNNQRIRIRARCEDAEDPIIDSVVDIWPGANWFEREAFDLFGILFSGHPDLRRILTDYGFIGHPFRKDFPLIGNVEVRYDADKQRVVYEPVSIEPRTLVPKVIRTDNRYDAALKTTK
ncbi:MAG TPA: NADH-quinone oxidoreductase subunit C [Steroidobacteraceae bacterium]|nr:NADH-quinone oxidoreductase subunit C [Steroidobacteraceae bacterium]